MERTIPSWHSSYSGAKVAAQAREHGSAFDGGPSTHCSSFHRQLYGRAAVSWDGEAGGAFVWGIQHVAMRWHGETGSALA